jgi:WD40 repeat protein
LDALGKGNEYVGASPDGRLLGVGGQGRAKVWDVDEQRRVKELEVSPDPRPISVRFSRDGDRLFAVVVTRWSSEPWRVRAWNVRTWVPMAPISTEKAAASVDFSPDDKFLAEGYQNGTFRLRDIENGAGEKKGTLRECVTALGFSPDGRLSATGSLDGTLVVWDTTTWQALGRPLRGHQLAIHDLAFSPDGTRVATGGGSGEEAVLLWDVGTQRRVATLRGEGSIFHCVRFSPEGDEVVAINYEGALQVWHAPKWGQIDAAGQAATRR